MIEPNLQPLSGEAMSYASAISTDGARVDIAANGFWKKLLWMLECSTVMLHPIDKHHSPLATQWKIEEKTLRMNRGWGKLSMHLLLPLCLSATGGMGREATSFYKWLASSLATKWKQLPGCVAVLPTPCSDLQFRGARSRAGCAVKSTLPLDLISSESGLRN